MPRIPRAYANAPYPGRRISPERATVEARAWGQAGEKLAAVGDFMLAQEQRASRAEKALRIENQMNDDLGKLAESYYDRIDYENFEDDAQTALTALKQKYLEMSSSDRDLRISVEQAFNTRHAQFMHVTRNKKRQVLVERALGEHVTYTRNQMEAYANATDEDVRADIAAAYAETTQNLANRHIMSQEQAETDILKWANDADELRLDRLIELDPDTAAELMAAGGFPGLAPDKRIEKETKIRIRRDEKDRKEKLDFAEAKKVEERNIGDLVLAGNYSEAYSAVKKSTLLEGPEKVAWTNSIEAQAKKKDLDPILVAEEWNRVNDMMISKMDAEELEKYIIQSAHLHPNDKIQLLERSRTKFTKEIDDGVKAGYGDMKVLIFTSSSVFGEALPKDHLESFALRDATIALDDWVKDQMSQGKRPNMREIVNKARELAYAYQVKVADRIRLTEERGRERAAELKAEGEAKLAERRRKEAEEQKKRREETLKALGEGPIYQY